MIRTKVGCFICRIDILRLTIDSLVALAWMICDSMCGSVWLIDEECRRPFFLIPFKGVTEVIDHDKAGLLQGTEFRNDFSKISFLNSYLLQAVSSCLQVPAIECTRRGVRVADVAAVQGTQATFSPGNR